MNFVICMHIRWVQSESKKMPSIIGFVGRKHYSKHDRRVLRKSKLRHWVSLRFNQVPFICMPKTQESLIKDFFLLLSIRFFPTNISMMMMISSKLILIYSIRVTSNEESYFRLTRLLLSFITYGHENTHARRRYVDVRRKKIRLGGKFNQKM